MWFAVCWWCWFFFIFSTPDTLSETAWFFNFYFFQYLFWIYLIFYFVAPDTLSETSCFFKFISFSNCSEFTLFFLCRFRYSFRYCAHFFVFYVFSVSKLSEKLSPDKSTQLFIKDNGESHSGTHPIWVERRANVISDFASVGFQAWKLLQATCIETCWKSCTRMDS